MRGKPSFLPCLLMRDLCCRENGEVKMLRVGAGSARADFCCRASRWLCASQASSPAWSTHDVGDDAAARDGGLDQRVQLLITTDGKLEMAGGDALHLQVLGGVAGQLQHLGGGGRTQHSTQVSASQRCNQSWPGRLCCTGYSVHSARRWTACLREPADHVIMLKLRPQQGAHPPRRSGTPGWRRCTRRRWHPHDRWRWRGP